MKTKHNNGSVSAENTTAADSNPVTFLNTTKIERSVVNVPAVSALDDNKKTPGNHFSNSDTRLKSVTVKMIPDTPYGDDSNYRSNQLQPIFVTDCQSCPDSGKIGGESIVSIFNTRVPTNSVLTPSDLPVSNRNFTNADSSKNVLLLPRLNNKIRHNSRKFYESQPINVLDDSLHQNLLELRDAEQRTLSNSSTDDSNLEYEKKMLKNAKIHKEEEDVSSSSCSAASAFSLLDELDIGFNENALVNSCKSNGIGNQKKNVYDDKFPLCFGEKASSSFLCSPPQQSRNMIINNNNQYNDYHYCINRNEFLQYNYSTSTTGSDNEYKSSCSDNAGADSSWDFLNYDDVMNELEDGKNPYPPLSNKELNDLLVKLKEEVGSKNESNSNKTEPSFTVPPSYPTPLSRDDFQEMFSMINKKKNKKPLGKTSIGNACGDANFDRNTDIEVESTELTGDHSPSRDKPSSEIKDDELKQQTIKRNNPNKKNEADNVQYEKIDPEKIYDWVQFLAPSYVTAKKKRPSNEVRIYLKVNTQKK